MSANIKQYKKVLVIGLVAVCIFYMATMDRTDSKTGSLTMTSPTWHFLYVGETGFSNPVSASAFFTSTHTFPGGDGCPCSGIFKPTAVVYMLGTWQFYANWFVFSSLAYILFLHVLKDYKADLS